MRLIDADALKAEFTGSPNERWHYTGVLAVIENAPTFDAKPVVHGHWIGLEYDGYADGYPVYDLWECSVCGNEISGEDTTVYCCNCGAKMDEVREVQE